MHLCILTILTITLLFIPVFAKCTPATQASLSLCLPLSSCVVCLQLPQLMSSGAMAVARRGASGGDTEARGRCACAARIASTHVTGGLQPLQL